MPRQMLAKPSCSRASWLTTNGLAVGSDLIIRLIALDTGAHLMFSERRDTGWEGRFFLPHETKAATALNWLMHVQTHENDVRGPWKRWNTMGMESRADWRSRYRYLVKGFLRAARAYRATRASNGGGR